MKMKLLNLVMAVAACIMLASCDPACTIEWVMVNHSGHDVVITRYNTVNLNHADTIPEYKLITRVTTLKNGDSLLVEDLGRLGSTSYGYSIQCARYEYWRDSVQFAFDDGTTHTFVDNCDTTWGPYAFHTDNYSYQEKANEGITFHGYILWSRLTYRITSEDYERCKSK